MSEQLDSPRIPLEEVGGPQHTPQNAAIGHETIMGARPAGSGTVAEIIAAGHQQLPAAETLRREYREGLAAQQPPEPGPGQIVGGRHETVQELAPPKEQ